MVPDDELFAEALDLATIEREDFLTRVCTADTGQRARIEALLAAYSQADGFLENSVTVRPPPESENTSGDVIGRYSLIRKIGEGGCGVVYLAEQREPIRRRVALKVIKLGMDTRQVILRFEAERQALAMMDHPNIARVFDAGATDAGRPYFVMELVDGVPITQYCDEQNLTVATRLELFAQTCEAVQHAHQKGIIHRDLKPSNILVALRDGKPTPIIIDFGIAKATQGRLTEHTLYTRVDQFMGTPAYMSPEQAELRDLDIDTRSDLYSLGVVLYELLTGSTPVDSKRVRESGIDELRRMICEVDAPRPSARVSAQPNELRLATAQRRQTTTAHLIAALRRDLDWIVIRCLEKERNRRYGTAHDLTEDLRRHLRGEPVVARPPQTLYTVQKFVSRNRWACAAVAAIAISLVAGTIISLRQAIRATQAERQAFNERDAADAANRAEALARKDAQRRQEQAEDILSFLLGDFRTELKKAGRLNLLDAVGEKALTYFNSLDPRDLTDTALARQAKALTQIGEIRFDEARYPEAEKAFTTAYERAAALAQRYPNNGDMLFERAQAEYWLGFVHRTRGEFGPAREWLARYRDSATSLVALEGTKPRAQRELASGQHNLAVLDLDRGNLDAARTGFLAELSTIEKLRHGNSDDLSLVYKVADIHSWIGVVAERNGEFSKAVDHFAAQIRQLETLVMRDPETARWQVGLAHGLEFKARVLAHIDQRQAAFDELTHALTIIDSLVAQDPQNRRWLFDAMSVRLEQAELLLSDHKFRLASQLIEEAKRNLEDLVVRAPLDRFYSSRLITAYRLEAQLRFATRESNAFQAIERAVQLGETLINDASTEDRVISEFAQACVIAGQMAFDNGHFALAFLYGNRAITVLSPYLLNSTNWRILEPQARALAFFGQYNKSEIIIGHLESLGHRPLQPWPAKTNSTLLRFNHR